MANTTVILSTSTHPDYSFPVVIAALLWKEIVGYRPFIFLCGSSEDWATGRPCKTKRLIEELGIHYERLALMDEWPPHVTAQNCRYYAAALSFNPETWLMLSDADLFPLKRDFYHQHEDYKGRFSLYYSNGDSYDNYPTCHISARVKDWREVMGILGACNDYIFGNFLDQMTQNLRNWIYPRIKELPPSKAGMEIWQIDMWNFMDRIKKQPWHPTECKMIEREGHPPKDRLDRSNWPSSYDVGSYTDAHIIKEPYTNKGYAKIRPIVERLIPGYLERIDRFQKDFINA